MKTKSPARRMAVRWLPIDSLRPDPNNARVHSDLQVQRIADSIAAFGFNVPVLVDRELSVLAGHGRVLAARRLELREVPAIMLDHLNEAQRRAFLIADNRLAELASWDDARLGLELEELRGLDLDFGLETTGFVLSEIDLRIEPAAALAERGGAAVAVPSPRIARRETGVLRRPMRGEGQDEGRGREAAADNRPAPHPAIPGSSPGPSPGTGSERGSARAVARAGDAWALGPHRLVCADEPDADLFALDAAIRRWQAASGRIARLHPTGETFASVARARRLDARGRVQ